MNVFNLGEKVVYLGLWGTDFNKVDEVVGIVWDDVLQRKKYLIRESESGEVLTQYGDNYRLAEPDEIAAGHRLRSNNGQNICAFSTSKSVKSETLIQYLDRCEQVVKGWPKWKLESIRDAFGMKHLT
ncbi:hypothetical protein [Acinetobacter venetianus]|uniref:hypothetical protein n=1 Tax=Acinetobacter venetianus TaxID=52133 RepID=UPI001022CCF2|nr:hypothetical protein [Acinetobacter venetianus]RZG79644.1 hypothetical protein EXE23_13365 [Acinetobacter venetianus]